MSANSSALEGSLQSYRCSNHRIVPDVAPEIQGRRWANSYRSAEVGTPLGTELRRHEFLIGFQPLAVPLWKITYLPLVPYMIFPPSSGQKYRGQQARLAVDHAARCAKLFLGSDGRHLVSYADERRTKS